MAIAGLENVPVYDSAFLRENQSPASRLWGEPETPNPRPSSVLQMWREMEGEHVVNHPHMRPEDMPRPLGSETSCSEHLSSRGSVYGYSSLENVVQDDNETVACSPRLVDSDNEHEDSNSFCSEQSTDLGETGRGRVRQVFHEWMSSGVKNHSAHTSHRNKRSRSPWLGQNEFQRVRIIREWVQINTKQRGVNGCPRDESASETGSQIEQVRDGQLVSHREASEQRPLRKLCGRQAVLDMLVRAQRERKEEINKLLQNRPVSDFAHRNRIQTLLKGRFLLNQRLVRDERPVCTAVNELGLLRQRHAVSNLRDGFLSRRGSLKGGQCDSSSNNDLIDLGNEHPRSSNELDDEGETDRHSVHVISQTEQLEIQNSQSNAIQDGNGQEHIARETEIEVPLLINNNREDETSNIDLIRGSQSRDDDTLGSSWQENSPEECSEQVSNIVETVPSRLHEAHTLYDANNSANVDSNELYDTLGSSWQENSPEECSEQVSNIVETVPTRLLEAHTLYDANNSANVDSNELVSGTVETVCSYLGEAHPTYNANYPQNVDASAEHGAAGHMYSMAEEFPLQELSAYVEELQESESGLENDLQQFSGRENSQWTQVNIEVSILQETNSQWCNESATNDVMEQTQMQESDEEWPRNLLQEAIDSWLDVPSGQETGSVGRDDTIYFPDEENIRSTELRQLLSRRRVSTLLRSGFRESLDQLIQSYVQRQNDASAEWDQDERLSSHASLEQEPQHHNQDPEQETHWGMELQDDWPDLNPHQHTQNLEWEIINELRIDMAMLKQRMNNMQNIREEWMDLQPELQRSFRQEVSAALNKSFDNSTDNAEITINDIKWDRVKKVICCVCCDSHIDRLLCGHMCTCSKCAQELVQGGKCPMCYAPVLEVVRAYFIQ